jgi:hypothetical protein
MRSNTRRALSSLGCGLLLAACGGADTPTPGGVMTFTGSFSGSGDDSGAGSEDGSGGTGGSGGTSGDGDGTSSGDGDGTSSGDGDGTSTGDGDGTSTGDGDGTSTGDGDGTSSGDGDGTSSGDGDGTSSGDGDGTSSGDGDGTSSGDGDGTSSGDGDGTATGDGDGTSTGDGDGTSSGDGDGTSTGDGDGDGTSGDGDGATPCSVQPPTVEFEPPNIIFVLDKSGSMMGFLCYDNPPPPDLNDCVDFDTLWEILHDSLQTVISSREDSMRFGIKWFPTEVANCDQTVPTDQCKVVPGLEVNPPAMAGAGQWTAIDAALPPALAQISGSCLTPGQDGYDRASEWVGSNLSGETTAMVLFFDGALSDGRLQQGLPGPDCNDSTDAFLAADPYVNANSVSGLTSSISANATAGIDTYVIGFFTDPAIDAEMNGYAAAGNTDAPGPNQFFLATNPQALVTALDQIATQVATCDISVTLTSPNPNLTEVVVNGVTYSEILPSECASQNGFYYIDGAPTYQEMRLCGQACTDFTTDPSMTDVNFFCSAG